MFPKTLIQKVAFRGSGWVKKYAVNVFLVKIKLQNPNYLTRLGSRIQDGKRGGGQRCRELQQQRQGGNLRIGHASQLAASSHGIPTQISGLLKTRLNQPCSTTTTVPSGVHNVSFCDFHCQYCVYKNFETINAYAKIRKNHLWLLFYLEFEEWIEKLIWHYYLEL